MSDSVPRDSLKDTVARRAGFLCEYCLSPLRYSPSPFSVEHIIPKASGGATAVDNLALACQGCNNHKYTATEAIDPATGQKARLYHPRHEQWEEHFQWSRDGALVIGKTPIGRATVERLHLNRSGLVELRKALVRLNAHPPIRVEISDALPDQGE